METNTMESLKAFGGFITEVASPGLLDERCKELLTLALIIREKCGPCLDAHIEKAEALGISLAEIDEVAWSAVAMGGASVRMFYAQWRKGR